MSAQLPNRNYAILRKRLNLTLDDVDEQVSNEGHLRDYQLLSPSGVLKKW